MDNTPTQQLQAELQKAPITPEGMYGLPAVDYSLLDPQHLKNHNSNVRNSSYFEAKIYGIPPDVVSSWCTGKMIGVNEKKGTRDVFTVVPTQLVYFLTSETAGCYQLQRQFVPLKSLTLDMHTQVRGSMNLSLINKIAESINRGLPVRKPFYVYDARTGNLYIADGWHRTYGWLKAADEKGEKEPVIAAYVVPGDREFARRLGLMLNIEYAQQSVPRAVKSQAAADATEFYLRMLKAGTPVSYRTAAESYSVHHYTIQSRVKKMDELATGELAKPSKDRVALRSISVNERNAAFVAMFSQHAAALTDLARVTKRQAPEHAAPLIEVLGSYDRLNPAGGN